MYIGERSYLNFMRNQKKKQMKKFLAEFKNGSQIVIKAETRRDAIEFSYKCGDMISVREMKNAQSELIGAIHSMRCSKNRLKRMFKNYISSITDL